MNQSFTGRTEGSRKRNNTHQHTTHKEERREGGDSEDSLEAIA
jgi:hypothetical protein